MDEPIDTLNPAALPEPPPPPQPLEPVAKASRITEMDIVRGLAILGVFLINMPLFNAPAGAFFNNKASGWWVEWNHQAALWFIKVFAQGKFYTLFSFLFGMGFGVQMIRAADADSGEENHSFRAEENKLFAKRRR